LSLVGETSCSLHIDQTFNSHQQIDIKPNRDVVNVAIKVWCYLSIKISNPPRKHHPHQILAKASSFQVCFCCAPLIGSMHFDLVKHIFNLKHDMLGRDITINSILKAWCKHHLHLLLIKAHKLSKTVFTAPSSIWFGVLVGLRKAREKATLTLPLLVRNSALLCISYKSAKTQEEETHVFEGDSCNSQFEVSHN
jgi:hypothetical protein